MDLNLKLFFGLIKTKQQPFEKNLITALQQKVTWIKKTSTYDLNQRQKDSLQRDRDLVLAIETYLAIQHQIISHLFEKLETAQAETAALLHDKHEAESRLQNLIKRQYGEV
jgi:predicted metal-dependent hydrolase